jgi:hypothetical protein
MVKNRKSPKEMVEQLNFVLGEDTDEFVQWYARQAPFIPYVDSSRCTLMVPLQSNLRRSFGAD